MKSIVLAAVVLGFSLQAFSWGKKGHSAVARVAQEHLNQTTKSKIKKLLKKDSLSDLANWPDHIKSYNKFRSYGPWHYTTVKDGEKYAPSNNPYDGSIVEQIKNSLAVLKGEGAKGVFSYKQHLAWLVHLVGDIHQPLHVGRPGDKGGNSVIVKWFGKPTNLHSIWDSKIINFSKLSYIELAEKSQRLGESENLSTEGQVEDWANESVELRKYPYDLITSKSQNIGEAPKNLEPLSSIDHLVKKRAFRPDDSILPNLNYSYHARNFDLAQRRIYQAGLRLAKLLNELYSKEKKPLQRQN